MRKIFRASLVMAVGGLLTVVSAVPAIAASVVDQINNPSGSFGATNFQIGNQVGQSFVPTLPQLAAVEVDVVTGNPGAGETVTLKVLDGDRIISSQSQYVTGGFAGWVHFDLPAGGITVTPGKSYTIQLEDAYVLFFWKYASGNTYPNGSALFHGALLGDGADFYFRTFGSAGGSSAPGGQSGIITTVAGNGTAGFSGDGGTATSAALSAPGDVAADASGNLLIADAGNSRVRKISAAGIITTVAGNGTRGFSGDGGPATAASLNLGEFARVAVDSSGNLFIADSRNNRIRKVSAAGTITTVAGNGTQGFSGDGGPATSASLSLSAFSGLAVDGFGNLYIADSLNNRVRKVSVSGVITTVAGDGSYAGSRGDGGQATRAGLTQPLGVALDSAGNLFVADSNVGLVRKVSASGVISTVAGSGCYSPSAGNGPFGVSCAVGDGGAATSASMYPIAVAVDPAGNLFIADGGNGRIRKVTANNLISTVAGNGTSGFSGDGGPATSAAITQPHGVAIDPSGNLYIADTANHRIRKVSGVGSTNSSAPSILPGGIVPVGSAVSTIQPGEWVSIYGTNLAGSTVTWNGTFPTSLGGTSVTINGRAAYLSLVSSGQINLQAPNDTVTGTVPVVVTTANGTATASVTLAQFGPSFFLLDAKHVAGIVLRSNGSGAYGGGSYDIIGPTGTSIGYPTVAARPGDSVEIFAGGLGPTHPAVTAGQAYSGAAPTTNAVKLLMNNVSVTPTFAGLSGAGLYQINFSVPSGLGTGDVALLAIVGGVQTPAGAVISLQAALPAPKIQSLNLTPNSVYSGGTVTGTVALTSAAPAGGAVVALYSASSMAPVPATVTVPAGATSATFDFSAGTVSSNQPVAITASYGGASAQAIVTVGPPRNSQCTNISGDWIASESGSMTITIAATSETDSETDPWSGSGSVTIAQTGCSVQYNPILTGLTGNSLTPSQLASLVRKGTVDGNNVTVTGAAAVVDTLAGAESGLNITAVSSNTTTATGQVSGNVMTLDATGKVVASGTYSIDGQSGSFTLTMTLESTATFNWAAGLRPTYTRPSFQSSDAAATVSSDMQVMPDPVGASPLGRENVRTSLQAAIRRAIVFAVR